MNKNLKIYERVLSLYNSKKFKEVEDFYELLVNEHSKDSKLLNILASSLVQNKEYMKAIEVFNKLLVIDPNQQHINLNLGNLHRLIGNQDQAAEHLLKEVSLNENNYAPHYNLALLYEAKKETLNAINHYEESLKKLTDEHKNLTEEIGNKYIRYLISVGKNADALVATKELILKLPDSEILLGLLGNLYTWAGNYTLAIDQYYKALKINKNNKTIKYDLSICLRHLGKLNEAIDLLKDLNYLNSRALYIENLFLDGQKEEFINQLD